MVKTQRSQCGGPGVHAGQGARSHLSQLKIPCVATKTSTDKLINHKTNLLKKITNTEKKEKKLLILNY